MKMKLVSVAFAVSLPMFLSSCSVSQRFYHPYRGEPAGNWEKSSSKWGGYSEKVVGPQHYKVKFTSFNKPGPDATRYFTKVRAAELALLAGKEHFYLSDARLKERHQFSHFPAHQEPGYYGTETERFRIYDGQGHLSYGERDISVWHPGRFIPARDVINYIYTAERDLRLRSGRYTRYNAYDVLSEAMNNKRGYGRPTLDPRVKAKLDAWAKNFKASAAN